jgi:hypothetical protein
VNALKNKIELRYGKTITYSAECDKLASHIYHAIGVKISAQTLRRVLGFINDGAMPSKSTLQVICNYCNVDHVEELFAAKKPKLSAIDLEQINFIKSFYAIDLSSGYDFNYQKACGNIARKIINQPNYLEALSGFLTSNAIAQIFFFERFPYIDGIAGDYKKHFKRYVQSKKDQEAQLFGNCILFLGAYLSQNKIELTDYLTRINSIAVHQEMHPFPQARKIMSNILYHHVYGNKTELGKWKNTAFEEEKKQLRGNTPSAHFPFFQFTMADAFNLIGDYGSALKMIHLADLDYKRYDNGVVELGYFECFDLVRAITYYHIGRKEDATRILNRIESAKFIFICHDYFLIQQKILELNRYKSTATKKYQKIETEISGLINKTGFTTFKV